MCKRRYLLLRLSDFITYCVDQDSSVIFTDPEMKFSIELKTTRTVTPYTLLIAFGSKLI